MTDPPGAARSETPGPGCFDSASLTLDLSAMRAGTSSLRQDIPLDSLRDLEGDFDIARLGPAGVLTLEVVIGDGFTTCKGVVSVDATLVCARCLDEFEIELSEAFERRFGWLEELVDDDDLEMTLIGSPMETVGILDGVREAIILSVPRMPLCSPDCRGLCPFCGANLNREQCEHYSS